MLKVDVSILYEFITGIFVKAGVKEEEAAIIADSLIQADQRGVHSHGIVCVTRYINLIRNGYMKPVMDYEVKRDQGAVCVWDGKRSNGQILGYHAMKKAIEKAKQYGIGAVGVKNANHFGAGAYYARLAEREGMIGMALSTGDPTMAPWGGAEKAIGNNPIAIAVPAKEENGPLLDMAQSVVANGRIANMMKQGIQEIPEGWALDKDGMPTTKMADFYSVMPTGAYKGFGTSFMIDVLSGLLFGGGTGFRARDDADGASLMMMAWNIEAFRDFHEFTEAVDERIKELKAVRKAKNVEAILMPGEKEAISYAASAHYVEILPEIMEEVNKLAESLGMDKWNA